MEQKKTLKNVQHVTPEATFEEKKMLIFFCFSKFSQILKFHLQVYGRKFRPIGRNPHQKIFFSLHALQKSFE
jgi:hypothetical protein